jgi:hypothetical protein
MVRSFFEVEDTAAILSPDEIAHFREIMRPHNNDASARDIDLGRATDTVIADLDAILA